LETFKSLWQSLPTSSINDDNFEDIALSLFRFQVAENRVYYDYLTHLGVHPQTVKHTCDIPFLPISFFKNQDVATGHWVEQSTFVSSATTGAIPSRHRIKDMPFYLANARSIFELFYGALENFHFLALLPSYLERGNSSLVAMLDYFIRESKSEHSGFYLNDRSLLYKKLNELRRGNSRKVMLWGVSFALMDMADEVEIDLDHCMVMETGGMKGRREEITRGELHDLLCKRFNIKSVHSEYGMTELLSQAYSYGNGCFQHPPWMKIMIREVNDPFTQVAVGKTGGLNVIDLANIHSCAFVETQDLGQVVQGVNFEILGRIDNSDLRGCNLLVE